jgi:hypothetical protein
MKINKHLVLVIAIVGFAIISNAQVPNYVPSNGLVGWWPFTGNANDESGNANSGTNVGATLTSDRFGSPNNAYSFSVGYIICGNIAIPTTDTLSISFWYNTTSDLYNAEIISLGSVGASSWGCIVSNSLFLLNYGRNCSGTVTSQINQNLALSSWHHVVFVSSGHNNPSTIFHDGINIGTYPSNSSGACLNSNLYFGYDVAFNLLYNGKLDDIGIWNRALTACEIQDIYHSQINYVIPAISAGADQTLCRGDSVALSASGGSNYQWNNNVVDGAYFSPTQTATYAVNGIDSLGCTGSDTVVISVMENASSTLIQTALDSYMLNGQTYTQSGTFTQVIPAANGCDSTITLNLTLNFTGIHELGNSTKTLVKIIDLNGKIIQRRKNTVMLFIYEDGTVERVVEMEE